MSKPRIDFTVPARNQEEANRLTRAAAIKMWWKCDEAQRQHIAMLEYPALYKPGTKVRAFVVSDGSSEWMGYIQRLLETAMEGG